MSTSRIKRFQRAVARYMLYAVGFVLTHLPYSVVCFLSRILITLGFTLLVRKKRIAMESLKVAFGKEKSTTEIKKILKDCFLSFGKGIIEIIYFMAHPKMIKERVVIENKHYLDEALSCRRGVVAVSAHFGNFPLMLLHLAQEGYPVNAIMRSARDEKIEEYFKEFRLRLGLKAIYSHPRSKCVRDSIRVLRNNEFLFIPLDQHSGSGGSVFVDFFGEKAATATGPVVFAMRTKSPILPIFIVRQKDDTHKIIIDKPFELEEREDEKEMIHVNVSKITNLIEQYIRRYPQEWSWMHRRWKK
ncbi:MAG: lysophospholipid acyltransferase family protein [Candidatus Omnitrophica bacterium]|nr:lysophospholipid acyltransferase family protein [Candidatus Omnitrophota bacterium]